MKRKQKPGTPPSPRRPTRGAAEDLRIQEKRPSDWNALAKESVQNEWCDAETLRRRSRQNPA
jgi:hypothetical protein